MDNKKGVAKVLAALEKLEANTVRARTEGLEDLKHVFGHDRALYRIDEISDNTFHTFLESIFRIVRSEKASFVRTTTLRAKNDSQSRLTSAASALRLIVDAVGTRLKQKTACAALDHVIDTLPDIEGGLCEPIQLDYVRSLSLLLSHAPRGEHLRHKQWQTYADFILETINQSIDNDFDAENAGVVQQPSATPRNGTSILIRMSQSSAGKSQRHNPRGHQTEFVLEELLTALKHLTGITNAPLVTKTGRILELVVRWLQSVSRSEETAFEILTNVLPVALTEDVLAVTKILDEVSHIILQRDLWSRKSVALKDNILAAMILCRSVILSASWTSSKPTVSSMEQLLNTMQSEYEKAKERDRLQIEDLGFTSAAHPSLLSMNGISLSSETPQAIITWSTLSVIACLLIGVARRRQSVENDSNEDQIVKRRKLDNPLVDLFQSVTRSDTQRQSVAIQIALFVVDQEKAVPEVAVELLSDVNLTDLDDEPLTASWMCLLLARIADFEKGRQTFRAEFWKRVWSWACRASATTATSRAGCYLIYAMTQAKTIRSYLSSQAICDGIFPDGLSGPSTLTDAALLLLSSVFISGLFDTEKTFKNLSTHSIRWFDSQWTISSVPDRLHNAQIASFARSDNIFSFLTALTGHSVDLEPLYAPGPVSSVCKALLTDKKDLIFTDYMLSDNDAVTKASQAIEPDNSHYTPSAALLNHLRQAVIETLTNKAKVFYTACKTAVGERASAISLDMIETATSLCVLHHVLAKSFKLASELASLETTVRPLWEAILAFLAGQPRESLTRAFSRIASRLTSIQPQDPQVRGEVSAQRAELCTSLSKILEQISESQEKVIILDPEFLDSLESRMSQSSQVRPTQNVTDVVRSDLMLSSDVQTLFVRQCLILKMDIACSRAYITPSTSHSAMAIEAIIALEPEEMLATRDVIIKFLDTETVMTRTDSSRLLTKLAEVCLQQDDLERCEAALCLCLHVTQRLTPLWTAEQDDELADIAYSIYEWFVNTALGRDIASQRVLLALASLLDSVLRCNPLYAADTLPSARTSLLQILQVGLTGSKFQMLEQLSNLFNGYVLSEHSLVFDDIIGNLPSDPDKREGIVLRLYIIAGLGARWHTILRQSVYHIFETAANVPSTASVAAKCVRDVCHDLNLRSPQEILRLFAPQVLYTWLETGSIESIPFQAFGYDTVKALRTDIEDELVAQVAMRGSAEQMQKVVQLSGVSWDSLIERWFAKVVAYAVITDVSIQRSSREIGKAEMSLLQQLGEDTYALLCRANLAKAVSTILLRLSDDRGFDKSLDRDGQAYDYIKVYEKICSRSTSLTQLPPGQQPSFRAKHLIQVLDRMCMRAQETLESIWTPALFIHVYRSLLADARPAFGPLHTCAVLRKVRLVISLAGSVALSGYPLQMLLHTLRPFVTQFHSSEDALSIFWYLLEEGKPYLKQKIPFVTGLGVAMFASLSKFAFSSQDSTTQESHFVSTMSKAQEFRTWLGQYLEAMDVANLGETTASTFVNIIQAAKQITKAGSSSRATTEGSLLYNLLADQASEHPVLSDHFFRLTLRSLCHDFRPTADSHDDILYEDKDVLRIASVLWSILDHQSLEDSFVTWVLQALGRAYALQGPAIIEMYGSTRRPNETPSKTDIVIEDSYQSIVQALSDLLWDEDSTAASASEATLQSVFSMLTNANRSIVLGAAIDQSTFDELRFSDLPCPSIGERDSEELSDTGKLIQTQDGVRWASALVSQLAGQQTNDPVLSFLPSLITLVPSIAPAILRHVVHLALYLETDQDQRVRTLLTETFSSIFEESNVCSKYRIRLALETISHLRRCVLQSESTMARRNSWLAIDFSSAAAAALRCGMYRMALLMLEIHVSQQNLATTRSNRRSSIGSLSTVTELLSQTYQNVDDPDFFYGTHEESDVSSIVEKLCHEGYGYKALSFQSALFDSNIRTKGSSFALSQSGTTTVSALNLANLSGLSSAIGSIVSGEMHENVLEHNLQSLLNLHQWDIAQDRALSEHGTAIVGALRSLSSASQRESVIAATDQSTMELARLLRGNMHQRAQEIGYWTSLAVLAELKEILFVQNYEDLEMLVQARSARKAWTEQESFECIEPILLNREAIFATIKDSPQLRNVMGVTAPQAILLEIKSLRASLSLGHVHEMSQFCLNRAAYLSELLPTATELGVKVEAAIQYDLANTFWAQQETAASIRILQKLQERELPDQAIEVQQAEILTDLGSKITQARLDRPDEVTAKYLVPAIKALGKETMGSKVGRVFHNFAAFCDGQLKDPDSVDEYERVEKIRDRKLQEVCELEEMYRKGDSKVRETVKAHFSKAKTWFKLDDEELQRLKAHRDRLVRNCLENYLLSLRACEDFPNDVLRFLALWMEQSTSPAANTSVSKYLSSVPTYKFAPLMNQLSSRILNEESPFQQLLTDLMYHICEDHPFHSLYQIFATSKSKGAQKDEVANSRHNAATKLSEKVMKKSSAGNLWISIHNSNIQFVRVAQEKIPDKELKTGSKLLLRKLSQGAKLEQTMHDMHHKIPPPTMKIDIRPDKEYSSVSTIARFDPQISIAGGVSVPKIVTVIAADGSRHKMLLKGGNDDLRQDSIMEQVFEQVSNLLKDHRRTRQRKLGIRTYKVIPLTHNAGIIEFVRNTMPLHDYVLPAHTRYYPKDYKPNKCRKEISDAQSKSLQQRLTAYRTVVANFHPVMRFFFMEYFLDPDEWFQKRLSYSRSTAAISMLGHVLGLGDRHGHNILLDTNTGEVVHIDLGVAFEAGRVLPIPEVVPFRLTRDLVDGMGLSGVEGVFRRCCNFTLEALRRNQEAIMTILDVLRWDPLYSWSVSPLRLARMQENQEQAANNADPAASEIGSSTIAGLDGAAKRSLNEPSEADRALAVVSKKLGKSLSVEATVNELIRQAMDERNLAVLYCGWAAYA